MKCPCGHYWMADSKTGCFNFCDEWHRPKRTAKIIIKQVLNDITTAEKEIKCKEKEFYKEWTKWGRPKHNEN